MCNQKEDTTEHVLEFQTAETIYRIRAVVEIILDKVVGLMSLVTHKPSSWLKQSKNSLQILPVQITENCYLRLLQRFFK